MNQIKQQMMAVLIVLLVSNVLSLALPGQAWVMPVCILLTLAGVGLGGYLSWQLSGLADIKRVLNNLVFGKYDDTLPENATEIGQLFQSLIRLQSHLASQREATKQEISELKRYQNAIDNLSSHVMLADADFNITYVNDTLKTMFRRVEPELKKLLPHFSLDTVVGTNIDVFHKNPAHQRGLLSNLTTTLRAELPLQGVILSVVANPILEGGQRIGTVVEWADLTAERAAEVVEAEQTASMAQIAAENARIRAGLDAVKTNVMLADKDYNILYLNNTLREMMTSAEKMIQQDLPNFHVDQLVGTNIDIFHKDPSHQRRMLDGLTSTYVAELSIGGGTFEVIATPIFDDKQRVGTVVEWADLTQQRVREAEDESRAAQALIEAQANERVKQSLDNVSGNVMIADADLNIVYMNRAITEMMAAAEMEIRQQLPNFDVSRLIGENIDVFHKNPAHQRNMLKNLSSTYVAELAIGGRHFRVIANPVMDHENQRIGTVAEWIDRTQELAVEQEIDGIVSDAKAGDLSRRVEMEGKKEFFAALGSGINGLLEVISGSFNDIDHVVQALAEGDLTQSIDKEYEGQFEQIKINFNTTNARLESVVQKIRISGEQIATACQEISEGNKTLSQRTEAQASSLEETASSMEELTSTVRNNADNAQQANQLAVGARELAQKGGDVVASAVQAMDEINNSSNKISDIIGVIDEIAFQTNLLALNASVEAARAGEQGRGFAVVATEVRNLAQRSATAAKEIKELINDSMDKVKAGSQLVNDSGATLDDIVNSVKKVGDIISEIAASSREQSAGIDEVNKAVTHMDEMTQQNAALAEQTSAASESSIARVGDMDQLIRFFKVSNGGGAAVANTAPAATTFEQPLQGRSESPVAASNAAPKASADDDWDEF